MAENTAKTMSLEEYKKKVEECLMKNYKDTEAEARKSVALYTDDFPEFLAFGWEPSVAATAIVLGY